MKCQQIKIKIFQNDCHDGGQDGSPKFELQIIDLFINQLGSNLNCKRKNKAAENLN